MKKKLFLFLSILVLIMPIMVFAEDPEPSADPTPTASPEPSPSPSASPEPSESPEPSTSPSPSPSVTPQEEKLDLTLKGVHIPGAELITPFSSDNSKVYEVKITDQSKFNLQYVTVDYTSKSDKLKFWVTQLDGQNTFKVFVQNKDNTKQQLIYTFKVIKEEANTYLSKLEVAGYAFDQAFNKDTTNYTVTIPYDVTTVTINANPEDSNAKVSTGKSFTKEDLQVGGNTITIKVTNGSDSRTYKIFITRSEQSKIAEKATSIISSKINSSDSDLDIPETTSPDSILDYIIIILGTLVLFSIGGIGIYFYIKTSPKRMKKELLKKKKNIVEKTESPIVEVEEPKKEEKREIEEL